MKHEGNFSFNTNVKQSLQVANAIIYAVSWHLDIQFYVLDIFFIKMSISTSVHESIDMQFKKPGMQQTQPLKLKMFWRGMNGNGMCEQGRIPVSMRCVGVIE